MIAVLSRDPNFADAYDRVQRARQADNSHGTDHRARTRAIEIACNLLAEGKLPNKLALARVISRRLAVEGFLNSRNAGTPYTERQIAYDRVSDTVDRWKDSITSS